MTSIFGLVRFSYLYSHGRSFPGTANKSLDERRAMLFDPKRLEKRFELFEAICLPSLRQQNPDLFSAILLTAADLPAPFLDRLHALTDDYPNLHVVAAPPEPSSAAMQGAVARHGPSEGMKLTFRLDDDDAVSADFSDRVNAYRQERYDGHCLTLLRGVGLCRLYGRLRCWDRAHPFVSAGLGLINRAGAPETIYDCGNHTSVSERFPTLIDASFPAYLQSSHDTNASSGHVPLTAYFWPPETMSLAAARERYAENFPLLKDSDFRFV